jgi:large repetitive protein
MKGNAMSFGDTIAQTVLGKPTVPEDTDNAPNVIAEGAAVNTSVGITAHSTFANGNAGLTYSLSADSSAGGFKIDPNTGVVTVADPSKIDFETSPGHVYTITVEATKNSQFSSEQTFTISVTDVAPSTPVDSNAAANTVAEGAANGTAVGITASSTDVNGPAVTWSLTGDTSGGGFTINAATGVITVADGTKIDYESAPGHAYTVTATASDGTLTSSHAFTINVSDVPLPTPVDTNAAANSVAEGAANGSTVGVTATANDPNGPATTYSLTGDTSGGGFTINATTGVVTVADGTKIDYESSPGHAYTITVQANDGLQTTSQNFTIGVTDVAPSTPTDSNAAANTVVEGAANGSTVGVTASSTDVNGPAVTYSLTGDTSGGGFTINAVTGVVTVADSTKIDFETAAGHAYTVTAQASDGTLTSSQTFTIAVTDVAPSTPVDSNAGANTVAEGAANGSTVGVTASSTDINGPAVTYSLVGDTSGGGYTINSATGVVTVADGTKIDYESAPGHNDIINVQASDGTLTSSQTFTIAVTDVAPSQPVDSNAAANTVAEGAAINTTVGVTASSTDVNGGQVTYTLGIDSSGGGFKVDPNTGVVSVADGTKIDYESSGVGHSYTVSVIPTDGTLPGNAQTFTIAVTDVAPSTPVDSNAAANTVVEGAANGTAVGVTASSTDVNGPAVTYSLIGDTSGGGFTINAATGVVTVADSTKIDFESSAGHAYTVTAQASDGTLSSSQTFTIAVTDVSPSTPVDSNAAANTVAEGAANGSTVGVTASSTDVNGPPVTYTLTGDTSGGGFTINSSTGVVTVADSTKIDYESSPGHAYTVTAQASDGTQSSSQTFTIGVTDVAPSTPVDGNAATNTIAEGAANGSTVGVTASSTDVNGPAVTYTLTGDTSGGGFTINSTTGVVTVADSTKVDFESSGGSYTVTAQASDGTLSSSPQTFTIAVTDVAPSTPVDSDAATNQVAVSAPAGTHVGVTASSTDVNGPAVTYTLTGDTSGGGFTINAATGVVTVADPSKIHAADPSYDITVDSSDGTLHSQQTFTIAVVLDAVPVVTAGHTLNYTENQAATAIDPAVTVTDSDNANLAHATVQITGNYVNGEDVLGFTNQNGITGSFNAATGTMTLTGSSSVANYQTALESVTYFDNSDNPSGAPRTVTIIANDGTLDSAAVTDTINVTPVNDAPVVTAGHTLNYTENQAATALDPALTVTDVDNTNLAQATVQITGNYANGEDVLGFTNQNGISGSFNAANGTLTLTGPSSVANYQTALDSITYVNTSENPSGLARTVTIITNDGAANSVAKTDTINVTPVNDAPVTTAGGTLNYTENQAATVIDSSVTVTDVDNANMASATVAIGTGFATGQDVLDANVTGTSIGKSYNAATGVLTLTGSDTKAHYQQVLDSVTYFNSSDNPSGADRTINYTVNDGALNSNTSTSTIHVTPVNDAPVVTATGTLAYTEDQAATAIAPALTVTDVDTATLASATVQISANYVSGEDVLAFTNTANITGSFNATTGTMTLTGTDTVAHYQTALESVTYVDTSENPSTSARTVTFTADDGQSANHQSAGSNHTITVASVDDAPTVTVPGAQDGVSAHTDTAITGISTNDVDAGALAVKVSLGTSHGNITLDLSGGATLADATTNGTHSVHITGTLTQVNAALSSAVYHGDAGFTGADALTVQTNDLGHTGTGGPLSSSVATVDIGVIPKVWFIDNTASAVGEDGSAAHPFHSIAAFDAVNDGGANHPQTNDYIYLKTGTGIYSEADGIHLLNGQQLVGGGDGLTFPDPLNNANTLTIANAGTRPVIDVTGAGNDAIHLAQDNTIHGLNLATENAAAIGIADNGGTVGTLNISNMDVGVDPDGAGALVGTLGQAISITHGGTGGTVALGAVSSSGGTTGIALGGALATNFTATSGTLSGHSGSELSINGGSGTVSVGDAIGDGTGTTSVSIVNRTGGTVTLSGNIVDSNDTGGGIGISGNANTTINFTGTSKALDTGTGDGVSITSNTGSTVNFTNGGLTVHTTSGTGFQDTVSGTVSVTGSGNTITTTTGTGLDLSHVTIGGTGVTFNSVSTNGAANGIVVDTVTGGAINVNGGTIAGATSNGVNINAAQDNISIAASVASTAVGHSVQVTNSGASGGNTIALSGAITDPGLGVNLDNNDQNGGVATVNISGGLNIDSTTHTGFNATNGGTVNVTNGANNSITTTTGTALDIANTTIGSSNVTFHDISSSGAVHGILLNTTGSSGGLIVTGDGGASSNHSGGQILSSTGDGVSLNSTSNVSLSYIDINNGSANGIHGDSVNNLTLNHDNVLNTGTNTTTSEGLKLGESSGNTVGVTGAVSITNSSISGSGLNNVHIRDTSGTISSLTVTGDTFNNVGLGEANSFLFEGSGTSILTSATFTGNTIANNGDTAGNGGQGLAHGLTVQAHDTATIGTFTASGNTFTNNGVQADFDQDGSANLTFKFLNNGTALAPMTGSDIQAINVFTSSTSTGGTVTGTIQGNHIGNSTAESGSVTGGGIRVEIQGHTDATLLIDSNVIQGYDGGNRGIDVEDPGPTSATGPVITSDVTITNNTVTPGPATAASGFLTGASIFVGADNQSGSDAFAQILRADIHGNVVPASTVTGEFLSGQIQYYQFTGTNADGIGQLVGTHATASAQLAATNTGSTSASEPGDSPPAVGITVIPGPITTPPLFAATGGVQASSPTPGETNLTQAELDSVVAAAIAEWAAAGASASQLAALHAVSFSVADLSGSDLSGNIIGEENSPTHITIDDNAAGHGWFVDPTPSNNSEFTHAQNAAGTDLLTDPSNAAAGHLDLLTTVTHELGHVLGLPDSTATSDAHDLMYINLVDGERRLPDAADVAQANANLVQASEAALPVSAQPAGGAPIVVGTSGNDTIDAGLGGKILFGGAGADTFVFGPDIHLASATAPTAQPITHVADYSAAQGDTFDFSALTTAFHASGIADNSLVRAVEDSSGTFATLQLNTTPDQPAAFGAAPQAGVPNWVNVAQLDGAHAGDAVNVLLDSHLAVHAAHIHVDLLV